MRALERRLGAELFVRTANRSTLSEVGARLHVAHAVDYSAEQVLRAGDADEELIAEYHRERKEEADGRFEDLFLVPVAEEGDARLYQAVFT
mgnify:CR=1 FL=1